MSANSYFSPADTEEMFSWEVEIMEPRESVFVVLGNLKAVGDGVNSSVVAMSILDTSSMAAEGKSPTYQDVSSGLPDSYLMHGLYDTAAMAARSSAAIIGRGPLFPAVTPEAKITKYKTPTSAA
jgi:hypothetical protein